MVALDYDPASLCGSVDLRAVRILHERHGKTLDAAYLAHIQRHHGGVPVQQYVTDDRGTTHRVGRFLPLVDNCSVLDPPFRRSCRGPARDARVDWGVLTLIEEECVCSRLLFGGQRLLPFAALCRGSRHFDELDLMECDADLLAFSYEASTARPRVVVWLANEAAAEYDRRAEKLRAGHWDEPVRYSSFTVFVASDFDEFLGLLRDAPGRRFAN